MDYLLLLYANEDGWTSMTPEQQQQGYAAYMAYTEALKKAGVHKASQRLQPIATATTVHVTDGVGRIQARGGEVIEIHPGDTIHTPPGEWHWHGAAPDRFMTHLAIWEAPADGPENQWGEQVSDTEYLAASPKEASR